VPGSVGFSELAYAQRQRALKASVARLAPWALALTAFFSLTARAGESGLRPDLEFSRSSMIEADRVTLMPPRLATLQLITPPRGLSPYDLPEAQATRILPHVRKVDFARDITPGAATRAPMLFVDDAALLPAHKLESVVTLARAGQALLARLTRFEGRTLDPGPGPSSGLFASQGTSPQGLTLSRPEGTTPAISRATALASVTPAPIEPEVIAAASIRIPAFAHVHAPPQTGNRIDTTKLALAKGSFGKGYLDLIDPDTIENEQKCLAEAIYFEARSEPESGQAAVAQVVLNRVRSGLYPGNVCGVVYQNRHRYKACQFTFACEGKRLVTTDTASWVTAQRIARAVMQGATYLPAVGASTHYHADYVAPWWSRKLKRNDRIGRHIFYSLRAGQT